MRVKTMKKRTFCKGCGKTKFLFKTESDANRFAKHSTDNFYKENLIFSTYFCTACNGWHVTSKQNYCPNKYKKMRA
jgi:hypothetical protein